MIGATTRVDEATGTYQIVFEMKGGTPPYAADPGTVAATPPTPARRCRWPTTQRGDQGRRRVHHRMARSSHGVEAVRSALRGCGRPRRATASGSPRPGRSFRSTATGAEVRSSLIQDARRQPVRPDASDVVAAVTPGAASPIRTADFRQTSVQGWMTGHQRARRRRGRIRRVVRTSSTSLPSEAATTGTLFDRPARLPRPVVRARGRHYPGPAEAAAARVSSTTRRAPSFDESAIDSSSGIPPFRPLDVQQVPPRRAAGATVRGPRPQNRLSVARAVFPHVVVLTRRLSGSDRPVAFLWEVQDGVPFLADGVPLSADSIRSSPPRSSCGSPRSPTRAAR